VGQRDNHEIRLKLRHAGTFPQDGRHGFIWARLSHGHFGGIVTTAEDIVSLKRLAAVTCHPALDSDLVAFLLLNAHSDELADFGTNRVVDAVLLLQGCRCSRLIASEEGLLLVQRGEDVADSFQGERAGHHVDCGAEIILQWLHALHLSNLWRLIDSFNIDANTVRKVWIFGIVAIEPTHSLLVLSSTLPSSNELRHLLDIHE